MFKLSHTVLNTLKTSPKNLNIIRYDKCLKSTVVEARNSIESELQSEDSVGPKRFGRPRNSIVAAAFAALKPQNSEIKTPLTDEKINKAVNIEELLSISGGNGTSRRHALKVVSTLSEWSSSGKVQLADFENDARFLKLCRVLTKGTKVNRNMVSRSEDLSTVLDITADEEAARLICSLTLSQMVKVMSTLSTRKRRSVLLLRTLAYNITASNEELNLKQSADLLYSMCVLNFVDSNLLSKICGDVSLEIRKDIRSSSVIGSIITSLGLLKYKNCEILDALSEWTLRNHIICRSQDVFSLFVTLATVNYAPSNSEELFSVLIPQMTANEASKPPVWLSFVWSLVILNQASHSHVSSVLEQEFVDKIEGNVLWNVPAKMKLLNINAAATHLLQNYSGNLLSPLSNIYDVNIVRTKESKEMCGVVVDTLKNLIQSENLFQVNTNSRMGFLIDAECILDKKCNPLPFDRSGDKGVTRVAIMGYDYHNMCLGKVEPTGANVLASRLLQARKYKVLDVSYSEFKKTDKLVHRVQYLENRLKAIVK